MPQTSLICFPQADACDEGQKRKQLAERWALDLHLPPALQVGQGATAWLEHSRDSFSFAKQGRCQIFPDYWKASGDTVSNTDHNSSLPFSATAWRSDLSLPRSVAELEAGFGMEQDSKRTGSCLADILTLPTPGHAAFTSAPVIAQLMKESVLGCDWKCQYRGSSGKSWMESRLLQHGLNRDYSAQAHSLSSSDYQPCAFATHSGVQQLDSIFSQVTEPLPAESQALLSTASAL